MVYRGAIQMHMYFSKSSLFSSFIRFGALPFASLLCVSFFLSSLVSSVDLTNFQQQFLLLDVRSASWPLGGRVFGTTNAVHSSTLCLLCR